MEMIADDCPSEAARPQTTAVPGYVAVPCVRWMPPPSVCSGLCRRLRSERRFGNPPSPSCLRLSARLSPPRDAENERQVGLPHTTPEAIKPTRQPQAGKKGTAAERPSSGRRQTDRRKPRAAPERPRRAFAAEKEESKEQNLRFLTRVKNPGTWALGTYGVYLLGGSIYYMFAEGWPFADAMYFTIQTGLGVGYGDLVPSTTASQLFTSGYVLTGNVFFAAALALFVEAEFRHRDLLVSGFTKNEDVKASDSSKTTAAGLAGDHSSLRGVSLLLHDMRTVVQTLLSVSLSDALSACIEFIYLDADDEEISDESMRGVHLLRRDIGNLVSNFIRSIIGRAALSYALLASWIVLEHYDLSFSILYSVSSITTFGIVAPESNIQSRWFTILFTLSGFAIYLNSVGKIAGVLVEQYELEQGRQNCPSDAGEVVPLVDSWTEQESLQQPYTEFLEMELLRNGLVDQAYLDDVREEFRRNRPG